MRKQSYKINRPNGKRTHWPIFAIVVIFIVLVLLALSYIFYKQNHSLNMQEQQKAKDEAQTESSKKNSSSSTNRIDSTNLPSTNVKQDVPQSQERISIVSFSEENNVVKSTARISFGDGLCVFTYSPEDDKPVIDSVQSTKSSCTSELSANQFSRIGDYKLNVTAYINGKRTEANQNVTIN